MNLVDVERLQVHFQTNDGVVRAVENVSFAIKRREILGVVGESGSGKSQLFFSFLGLLSDNARVSGKILFEGRPLLGLSEHELNQIRGQKIAVVFQDALSALHPYKCIGAQMTEALELHYGVSRDDAQRRALQMLDAVRLPEGAACLRKYPYELSGGMRQRVLIAMALLCRPKLLIADEPTTALDVSIQAQVLSLLKDLQREFGMSLVFITHDFALLSGFADRVFVMYGGRIMESGPVREVLKNPRHPYTRGLLASIPQVKDAARERLFAIPGTPPDPLQLPQIGCPFRGRCALAERRCAFLEIEGVESGDLHYSACPYH